MKKKMFLTAFIAAVLFSLVIGPTLNAGTKCLPGHVQEELDSYISGVMETEHIPGLAACIVKKKRVIWTGTYGYANIEKDLPVTEDTLFQLASVSKPIVVTAIMQLCEKGLFDLDDDVDQYLPYSVRSSFFPAKPVTFRMLLTHMSGMRDNWGVMPYYPGMDSPIPLADYTYNYLVPGGSIYDPDLNWWNLEPGTDSIYCNNAIVLVAYLVETISGMPFADYCDRYVFDPLEMNDTTWFLAGLNLDTLAMHYRYFDGSYIPYGYYGYSDYPAGLLKTSIREFSHFLIAYLKKGKFRTERVLKPATVDLILSNQFQFSEDYIQGLVWIKYFGRWGHSGADLGVVTTIYFNQETGVGVIILTNGQSRAGVNEIKEKLFEVGEN